MAFSFETKELKGSLLFIFNGKLTNDGDSLSLNDKIDKEISAGQHNLIFDLSNLEQCNSSGLNVMIRTLTKARTASGDLVLCSMNETLNKLFTITKINEIFRIYPDLDEAKKHFKIK
jgi:anti-anti-sigma factor|tara:strand:- start:44099 stop:44449 length:351 start_codon:yes stop_codon:yes gene_type:complete